MKWIKLFKDFQMRHLKDMSKRDIHELFWWECKKKTPDMDLIRFILENFSINVNMKDRNGEWTVLHWAAHHNNVELAELLIQAGADVNFKDRDNRTPLDWAIHTIGFYNKEMEELLKQHGAVE